MISEKEIQRRAKMRQILKDGNLWFKAGEKVVLTSTENTSIGVIDFIHSDDMISVNFNDEYGLYFPEQIRRPHKFELDSNKRIWKGSPLFHNTYGGSEFDD